MTGPAYTPLYPPVPTNGPPYPLKSSLSRFNLVNVLKYVLVTLVALFLAHYVYVGAFPSSSYTAKFRELSGNAPPDATRYLAAVDSASGVIDQLDPAAGQPGTFFRDAYVLRTVLGFMTLAEKEVKQKGLDTCNDQLGQPLIEAYHSSKVDYCLSRHSSNIVCLPVHRNAFSKWWPYPAAPCLSTNLSTFPDQERRFKGVGCDMTEDGKTLLEEMGRERFLGTDLELTTSEVCQEVIDHTMLVIGRQDQWNPFHVAEDLITTIVTLLIAARTIPNLVDTRVQLVFTEGFGMNDNHFTPVWDRMGAWAPRRLSLDPWGEGVCLTNAIHSVGAGASLLSAMGVSRPYTCASTITWAASHYYRHLFGLVPRTGRKPINVLWLSRAKLDKYAQSHNDWSSWRAVRHIINEKELVKRLAHGLKSLCSDGDYIFEDAREVPERWAVQTTEGPMPVRFMTIDPTVHTVETQIHFAGHTSILVSSHGGALGVSLFLPPGDATLIELQVEMVRDSYHFQHMAYEMGHVYEAVKIEKQVDVEQVWDTIRRHIAQAGR